MVPFVCVCVFFFFLKNTKEKMNINFLFSFFCVCFLCKFGMDGKVLSRPFQRIYVIFGVMVEL